jgi:two-component system, chemotaxis family, sensor kinase CheA
LKDIRQRLLATFQVEHREHIQHIRQTLERFEKSAAPTAGPELDEIFRRAHSLKGAARAVDLRPLEKLAHRLESLFSRVREGVLRLDKSVIKLCQQAIDASEDWMAATTEGRKPADPINVIEAIESLLGMTTAAPAPAAAPMAPPPEPLEEEARAPSAPLPQLDMVRMDVTSLDRIVNSAGQLMTESLRQDHVSENLRRISEHLSEATLERERVRKTGARVFQKLDAETELAPIARYVNYVDHQLRLISQQVGAAHQLQQKNAWALRSLAGALQQDVRQARMVPAENIFDGFRKMVRDLAQEQGKSVELHITGGQVQADRIVLQALKDPVMHILRNAVGHGLESESERVKKGKAPANHIDMTIEARGNQLLIVVEDDGAGVNLVRIAEIAVRKGLLKEAEVAERTSEELMRLVFLPGFSTTRFVTDVSGRGMGMSVVAEAASRLQGKVDIEPGKRGGTRVSISAPLSVSSHRLLLVSCQEQTYAIPLSGIERLHRVRLSELRSVESKPVIQIEGRQLPVVSLAHLLRAGESGVRADQNILCIVVMRAGARRLAVAVDAFLSERDAIIKDLPNPAANVHIAGGILLENGSVCLVLNPIDLVEGFQQSSSGVVFKAKTEAAGPTKPMEILIVDDSLTTRTLEKSVLEAHGYKVAIAVDGIEALNYLRSEPVGLVISDVQMPRLDGFGLLEEMKRDPRLEKIPVIIVSSLENREDQARGMALGADAYIVKRKFEQRALLETIRQIL